MFYTRNEGDTYVKNADQAVLKASLDRLIIYKNKRGIISQRIVTYIPTKEYLNRHKGDISHNKIDKLDKDFEGFLVYREWNGAFLFALVMKEGKAVKKFSLYNKLQYRKAAFREQKCETIELYEWFQDCFYHADDPIPYECGEPYPEYVGTYEYCYEDGEGSGDPCLDPANFGTAECGGDGEGPIESPPVDCAGVPFGTAYMSDDCGCIGGTTGITECSKDPCKEAKAMDYKNQRQSSAYNSLAGQPNSAEYGMEERLSSIPGNDYNSPNIRTTATNSFVPEFTLNSTEGYTIGFGHKHTNGTGPSPADVMTPFEFGYRAVLVNNPAWRDYYRDNMSVTTISGSNTYMMTIADWAAVKNIYDNNTASQLTTNYQQYANNYLNNNPNASIAERSEYALMQIFGSSINFYKQNPSTGKFEAYKLNASGNIEKINCP